MVDAGIEISDKTMEDFQTFKRNRSQHFMTLNIDKKAGEVMMVETAASKELKMSTNEHFENEFENFAEALLENHEKKAALFVLNFKYLVSGGGERSKLLLVLWVPESCSTWEKMVYASTANKLKMTLGGVHKLMQVNDESSLKYETFVKGI